MSLEPAGFWIRAAARLVDWVVLMLVNVVVVFGLAIVAAVAEQLTGRSSAAMLAALQNTTFIGWIGGFFTTLTYYSIFEGVVGSTIGKRLVGLHVIGMDGAPVRFAQGCKRTLGFFIDALFFGAIAAGEMRDSPEKQRLGDRWANTRVVRLRSVPPELRPRRREFVAAMIAAVHVTAVVDTITSLAEYAWQVRGG